ncbi:MAG: translation elongation factor Ts [Bacteroidales bacterium]|jgi:elongation factor Ts|nr:elongation factor Ts [Bacteroidales bacterium]MCR4909733.1 translation elongation factor Ts [Bacteroidales bacterium]
MAITAADVMKLRKMTSAGMMDCKKALEEANGDFDKAVGIIREKGKMVAAKRADRETAEGAVKARINGGKAILVALGCETDFVSRTPDFQTLADAIADIAIAQTPADVEALKACKMADGYTVAEAIEAQTGKTGEKHVLAYYALVEAPFVKEYIHTLTGKLGALVGFNKEVPTDIAKGVAMQVASMNPVAISAEDCPAEVVENERKIAIEKTKEEQVQKAVDAALKKAGINPAHVDSEDHIESNTAKGWLTPEQAQQARQIIKTVGEEKAANLPEQMIQNIANGRVQKFFKEQTLEAQEYQMADNHISVKEALAAADKDAKIVAFKRFSFGD